MSGCGLCERERGDGEKRAEPVYRDALWSVYLDPEVAVPGWLVIQLRRHGEGPMGMNAEEAASFGPLLVRVTAALSDATAAEKVYVTGLGEKYDHWHVMVSARGADVAPENRGLRFFSQVRALSDLPRAKRVAARVAELLALEATDRAQTGPRAS